MKTFLLCFAATMLLTVLPAAEKPKALIIMLDGARADIAFDSKVGGLSCFRQNPLGREYNGAIALLAETIPDAPANSAPNHTAIATGVTAAKNGVNDNGQTAAGKYEQWPNVLSYLTPKYKTAFLYGWPESGQIKSASDLVEYLEVGDMQVEATAIERINNDSDALMVYINAPDDAGHNHGFYPHTDIYRQTFSNCDKIILNLLNAIKNRPDFANEDWLVIIVGDHGGYHQGHGMASQHATNALLAVIGKDYDHGFLTDKLSVVDVPATMLAHFGIAPVKLNLDGKVIANHVTPLKTADEFKPQTVKYDRSGNELPFTVNVPTENGFTIFMAVNAGDSQTGDAPLFASKDWQDGKNQGIVLACSVTHGGTGPGYLFNISLKESPYRLDMGSFDPAPGATVYYMISVQPDDKCFFAEFKPETTDFSFLTGSISNTSLPPVMPLTFGQDSTGKYPHTFNGSIEDVTIFPYAMLPDEILNFFTGHLADKNIK